MLSSDHVEEPGGCDAGVREVRDLVAEAGHGFQCTSRTADSNPACPISQRSTGRLRIPYGYALCMSRQIAVRIPDQLVLELDALVDAGGFESRADAVRRALEALVDLERRRQTGEAIARGYRRAPQSDEELDAAMANALRSIEEEPW